MMDEMELLIHVNENTLSMCSGSIENIILSYFLCLTVNMANFVDLFVNRNAELPELRRNFPAR